MRKSAFALMLAGALAGCAVTQPAPPQLDLPAATATAEQNAMLEHWWVAFNDPVLTALIDEAFANNLDLKATLARIEARACTGAASAIEPVSQRESARRRVAFARIAEHGIHGRVPSDRRKQRLQRRPRHVVRARPVGQVSERRARRRQRPRRIALLPRNDPHHGRSRRRRCVLPAARRRCAPRRVRGNAQDADGHRRLAARPLRFGNNRRVRPAPGRGGACGGRRRHRAGAAGDRAHRGRARDVDRPLAARGVHTRDRSRRIDRRGDRRPAAPIGATVGPGGTAPGHSPLRGGARRFGSAHPAGSSRLFSRPYADRRAGHRVRGVLETVHFPRDVLELRARARAAASST